MTPHVVAHPTTAAANGELLRQQLAQMRTWKPLSEKYRDLWRQWKRESEHLAGAKASQRVCGQCGGFHGAGEHQSAFLHFICWRKVQAFDAEQAAREAGAGDFAPIALVADSAKARMWAAVLELPEPMTLEDIVMAAWRADGRTFGLAGYSDQSADSAHVRNALYGPAGLLRRGYLVRKGKRYTVTPAGRALAAGKRGEGG